MTATWTATRASLATALAATLMLASCAPAPDAATQSPAADAASNPPPQADANAAAPTDAAQVDALSTGTIATDDSLTPEALASGNAWSGQPQTNASMQDIQERLRRIDAMNQAEKARSDAQRAEIARIGGESAPAPAPTPAPAPAVPSLPPANVMITGTTLVVKDPVLARDAVTQARNAFAIATGCRTISGIHSTPGKATGPFNSNAQGRLVSGTFTELWKISGCNTSRLVDLLLRPTPDGGVDIATSVRPG